MGLVERALQKLRDTAEAPEETRAAVRNGPASRTPLPAHSQNNRVLRINVEALRTAGLLPPEHDEPHIARQYRQIKRPLIVNAMSRGPAHLRNGHLILIASAEPGEGKTFTAINLAMSMSLEKDVHVLLVDADVAKPHISRLLDAGDALGLLDVVRDPAIDVESVVLPTDVPNLSILPAGKRSAQATELLASVRMEEVVGVLARNDPQRVMLFDSPPLLQTTESHALTRIAGQVLVVVRAADTSRQVLLDALSHLSEHPAVSLVLNQSEVSSSATYYHYGYSESPGAVGEPDRSSMRPKR